jgi:hypothetical protein
MRWVSGGLLCLLLVGGVGACRWHQRQAATRAQLEAQLQQVADQALYQPGEALLLAHQVQQEAWTAGEDFCLGQAYYWQAYLLTLDPRLRTLDATSINLARISASLLLPLDQPYWLARTYSLLSQVTYLAGMPDSANQYLNQGLMQVEQIEGHPQDSSRVLASLLTWQAVMLAEGPQADASRLSDALHTLDQAQYLARQQGDSVRWIQSLMFEGQIQAANDDRQAHQALISALQAAQGLGSPILQVEAWQALAKYHLYYPPTGSDPKANADLALSCARAALALAPGGQQYLYIGQAYQALAAQHPKVEALYLDSAASHFLLAMNAAMMESQDPYLLSRIVSSYQEICQARQECEQVMDLASFAYRTVVDEYRQAQDRSEQRLYQFERERMARQARATRLSFLIGAGLLLLLLGALFWVRYQRLRLAHLRQRLTYRLETLQAQMNPHFLSNSLNAIEALINVNRNRDASYYLIQFSRLSRLILTHSRKSHISLADEIKVLRHYLNLEHLRLNERLTYDIEVDPSVSVEVVSMPPLLLQPLVENAIWHGIQPKAGQGHLRIAFDRPHPHQLRCIVEDDGIGRARSQVLRQGRRQARESVSTDIIQERLSMMRRNQAVDMNIIDLHDDAGLPMGTRVELILAWTPTEPEAQPVW